jgi:hypothetical protein
MKVCLGSAMILAFTLAACSDDGGGDAPDKDDLSPQGSGGAVTGLGGNTSMGGAEASGGASNTGGTANGSGGTASGGSSSGGNSSGGNGSGGNASGGSANGTGGAPSTDGLPFQGSCLYAESCTDQYDETFGAAILRQLCEGQSGTWSTTPCAPSPWDKKCTQAVFSGVYIHYLLDKGICFQGFEEPL